MRRRRRNPRGFDPNTLLILAAIAGGGFLLLRALGALGKGASNAAAAAGEKAANLLEWFSPFDIGDTLQFRVKFPDGSFHAVGSRAIRSDGTFTVPTLLQQGGQTYAAVADVPALRGTYRMAVDKSIATGDNKVAIKV